MEILKFTWLPWQPDTVTGSGYPPVFKTRPIMFWSMDNKPYVGRIALGARKKLLKSSEIRHFYGIVVQGMRLTLLHVTITRNSHWYLSPYSVRLQNSAITASNTANLRQFYSTTTSPNLQQHFLQSTNTIVVNPRQLCRNSTRPLPCLPSFQQTLDSITDMKLTANTSL